MNGRIPRTDSPTASRVTDGPLDQAALTNRRNPRGSSFGSNPDVKSGWEALCGWKSIGGS